jgi:hypothetical protein
MNTLKVSIYTIKARCKNFIQVISKINLLKTYLWKIKQKQSFLLQYIGTNS